MYQLPLQNFVRGIYILASFPGPAQLFVAQGEPGNQARYILLHWNATCTLCIRIVLELALKLGTLSWCNKIFWVTWDIDFVLEMYILNCNFARGYSIHSSVFIIRLTYTNVWESTGKPCSCTQFIKSCIFHYKLCKNPYQYCKLCKNPYQYYKSCVLHLNVQWNRRFVCEINITIVPNYTRKNITCLPLALLIMVCTRNNTGTNKLVI